MQAEPAAKLFSACLVSALIFVATAQQMPKDFWRMLSHRLHFFGSQAHRREMHLQIATEELGALAGSLTVYRICGTLLAIRYF